MKKICVLTATRAEYGLLKNLIFKLKTRRELDVSVAVTGMHLSPDFGNTYQEIEADGIRIDKKIDILLSTNLPSSISKTMGLALIEFASYFEEKKFDLLVVLGDRYETLAVCIAAMNQQIPIAHLYGGEITEGAIDDSIRHAITKLSYLHFTSTEQYRKRVIQLGEEPSRVFNVGAIGVENILNTQLISKEELEKKINFCLGEKYCVVTYHPVTLSPGSEVKEMQELLEALLCCEEYKFIITKANSDAGGKALNAYTERIVKNHSERFVLVDSLGNQAYLSAMKYSKAVIGNSSSGIIEAPSLGVMTINIGDRQKGRTQAKSVINCEPNCIEIKKAMKECFRMEANKLIELSDNPYAKIGTAQLILDRVLEFLSVPQNKSKRFYDIEGI